MIPEPLESRRLLASPEVDLSFGEGGFAAVGDFHGDALLLNPLPNGKVVFFGCGWDFTVPGGSRDDPLVARFNPDGTLDRTFDGDGILYLPQGDGSGNQHSAAFTPDGKIVLVYAVSTMMRVFRFNPDGWLDPTFGGGDGMVEHANASGSNVAVQPDGKMVVSDGEWDGNGLLPTDTNFFLRRLNADGSIDASFGGTGTATLAEFVEVHDVVTGPDGKIYASGYINPEPELNPYLEVGVIARFNADGTLDTSFNGDGFVDIFPERIYRVENGVPFFTAARGNGLTVDGSGRLLVVSTGATTSSPGLLVTRFTTSGDRDGTLGGGDGAVTLLIPGIDVGIALRTRLVPGPGGKYYMATVTEFTRPTISRVNADLSLDTSFGEGGLATSARHMYRPEAMAVDAAGIVYVAGMPSSGSVAGDNLAVSRFVPESSEVVLSVSGILIVEGTAGKDAIALSRSGGQVVLRRNGIDTTFAAADVKGLLVHPSDGDDAITVSVPLPSTISGGAGNDTITAGDGQMSLEGGDGDDVISARNGTHSISGGRGSNRITTGAGNDTIFAGLGGGDTITTGPGGDLIHGGAGDDLITTSHGWDTIYTSGGDDTVFAGAGLDLVTGGEPGLNSNDQAGGRKLIFGGDGDDSLVGGTQDSSVFGGAGHDTLAGGAGADYLAGGAGDDVFQTRFISFVPTLEGSDTLSGGDGNDRLAAGDGDDFLFGDGGNDTLDGNSGDDVMHGAEGADVLNDNGRPDDQNALLDATPSAVIGANRVLSFSGTAGNDVLSIWADGGSLVVSRDGATQTFARSQIDRIVLAGNGGNDYLKLHRLLGIPAVLMGGGGDDRLIGGTLNDTLMGGEGNDHISGGGGDDTVDGGLGTDEMDGGAGRDALDYRTRGGGVALNLDGARGDGETGENDLALPDFEIVYGGAGDDSIGGGPANLEIRGGGGNDTLAGGNAPNEIFGDGGHDVINGNGGGDILHGGGGADTIRGGDGFDHLFGDEGHDHVDGNGGDDMLAGADGDDTLLGGTGSNAFIDLIDIGGGEGVLRFHGTDANGDHLSLLSEEGTGGIVVRLAGVTHVLRVVGGLDRIELNGYGGNDVIEIGIGGTTPTLIRGGAGNDQLSSDPHDATLLGGDGNDRMEGGLNIESMRGGEGDDTLIGHGHHDSLFGEGGNDLLQGGAGDDALDGGAGNDSLFGEGENDLLRGGDGDDYLEGGAGHDTLHGHAGSDALFGLAGNDRLFSSGDNTRDTVRGGPGDDIADVDDEDDVLAVEAVA